MEPSGGSMDIREVVEIRRAFCCRVLDIRTPVGSVSPSATILSAQDTIGHCIAASVKSRPQGSSIHSITPSNGDDPGPWFSAIPFIPDCDIHPLADNLEDDPAARLFGGMNHALASIDAGGKLARCFPHCFQGKKLFRFVAPRPEDLRVIAPMTMKVMPAIRIITVRRVAGLLVWRWCVELGGIKPPDRQQDFQRHVSAG